MCRNIGVRSGGNLMNFGFIAAAVISGICVVWWVIKSERGATSFAASAFQGIAAMLAVNLVGVISGVTVAVNWYTLSACALLGLPGVIGTLMLNFIMGV